MAKSHKAQHWIPKSYLLSWADPSVPKLHDPYVHVFAKDGQTARKKAPANLFTETDLYTIKLPDGQRDLRLEHGLSGLEASFSEIRRDFLSQQRHLPAPRYWKLMAFVTAMHSRTPSRRDHHMAFWNEVLEIGEEIEEQMRTATPEQRQRAASMSIGPSHTNKSISIDDVRRITASPMEHTLGPHMAAELPGLLRMRCLILSSSGKKFITSDAPVVWFDPTWHRKPPLFRSPSFSDRHLEITLPISPDQAVLLMHGKVDYGKPVEYLRVPDDVVTEINRRTRFQCDKEFIAQTADIETRWFEQGDLPPDAWELNEGKLSEA